MFGPIETLMIALVFFGLGSLWVSVLKDEKK